MAPAHHHHYHCNHDSAAFAHEAFVRTPQPYPHRRGLSGSAWNTSVGLWEPIRVNHTIMQMVGLTAEQEALLSQQLVPTAVAWVQAALRVVRSTGPLRAGRACGGTWGEGGVCGVDGGTSYCGVASDEYRVAHPEWALDALTVCTDSSTAGCTTSEAGAGYAETDFVLYVTSGQSSLCAGSTLAYASTCVRDQFDRPIFGHANFCPSALDASEGSFPEQLSTAVHEILHALGFASASWALFRDENGAPRTARDANGDVPFTASYACPDGTVGNFRVPSTTTLQVGSERGVTVTKMVTPRVAAVARDAFGCDTLDGAEIENQPTSAGSCWGNHWEQRLFMYEGPSPISHGHHRPLPPLLVLLLLLLLRLRRRFLLLLLLLLQHHHHHLLLLLLLHALVPHAPPCSRCQVRPDGLHLRAPRRLLGAHTRGPRGLGVVSRQLLHRRAAALGPERGLRLRHRRVHRRRGAAAGLAVLLHGADGGRLHRRPPRARLLQPGGLPRRPARGLPAL